MYNAILKSFERFNMNEEERTTALQEWDNRIANVDQRAKYTPTQEMIDLLIDNMERVPYPYLATTKNNEHVKAILFKTKQGFSLIVKRIK